MCACANISELVSVIRNETRALRPLVEKGIIRGFDIGDESGCPPEEAALAAAIHAELKGLERGRDYYVYKNEYQAHPPICPLRKPSLANHGLRTRYCRPVNTSKTNCCLAAGVPSEIDVVSFDACK